jgi:predicted ATPase
VNVLNFKSAIHRLCGEATIAQELSETSLTLAVQQGAEQQTARGTMNRGLRLMAQGQVEEGSTQVQQSLAAYRAMGARVRLPYYLAQLAEMYSRVGQPEAGLLAVTEALTQVEDTDERWYEAELHRLRGDLLLAQRGTKQQRVEAEMSLHQALAVARRQQAKSLELRASISLSRLWQRQGKHAAARQLLAEIYSWFTEGFDTADLKEAKTLLEELKRCMK